MNYPWVYKCTSRHLCSSGGLSLENGVYDMPLHFRPPQYKYNYYSFKIFARFWLVKTTLIIHHKQLLLTKNSVILNKWRQKCSPLQIIEPLTSKWLQKCSPLQIIKSLTSKTIEPFTDKTWAQGCVIQQREKWPRVEFTSLSEDNILNE